MMKIKKLHKWTVFVLIAAIGFSSCGKENVDPDMDPGVKPPAAAGKTLQWEVYHTFETGEDITQFEISDDAKWLFYTNRMGTAYRINKVTGEKSLLYAYPLEFQNGKLYLYVVKDNKSYFGVSNDFGATKSEYLVGTYTNYAAGWFTGPFMNLIVNRMFVMPDGHLILPHIMDKANNATYLLDNKLIAVSSNNGATWSRKASDYSYIPTRQGNRLFALSEGWTDVKESQLYYSDNAGSSWQLSNLAYNPQATDRENNLIAGNRNKIQKLIGNKWVEYTWPEESQPLVSITGLKYGGSRGDDPNGRQMEDIEFDADNNIYVIGKNRTTICRAKLN